MTSSSSLESSSDSSDVKRAAFPEVETSTVSMTLESSTTGSGFTALFFCFGRDLSF